MIKKNVFILLVFSFIFSGISFAAEIPTDLFAKFVNIKGAYLGQEPPRINSKTFRPIFTGL